MSSPQKNEKLKTFLNLESNMKDILKVPSSGLRVKKRQNHTFIHSERVSPSN